MIKALLKWLRSSVWNKYFQTQLDCNQENLTISAINNSEIVSVLPQKKRNKSIGKKEHFGSRYYFGSLLDDLDKYFIDFSVIKKGDPEIAAAIAKLGCNISDENQLFSTELEPIFYAQMPSIGCVYLNGKDSKEQVGARFIYFQKHKQPINVQSTNGVIYAMGAIYGFKYPQLVRFHVAVFNNGEIKVLKEIKPKSHIVGKKRNEFVRMEWSYPEGLELLRNGYNQSRNKKETVDEYAKRMFSLISNGIISSETGVNVRVKKNGLTATFAIDMTRTPYFFADRNKTISKNGKPEKILHIVRPHSRVNASGSSTIVKAHWRGIRNFIWNKYEVSIGMPGKHLPSLMMDFRSEAWNELDIEKNGLNSSNMISIEDAAEKIDKHLDGEQKVSH